MAACINKVVSVNLANLLVIFSSKRVRARVLRRTLSTIYLIVTTLVVFNVLLQLVCNCRSSDASELLDSFLFNRAFRPHGKNMYCTLRQALQNYLHQHIFYSDFLLVYFYRIQVCCRLLNVGSSN